MELSQFDRGVFLVNVLGVVYNPNTKQILIGRRENDPLVPQLQWCFPGGRPTDSLEDSLLREIKIKTRIRAEVKSLIHARIPQENSQFLLLYYLCETDETASKFGEKFVEAKWISPSAYKTYFTTSVDPKIAEFLDSLI